MVKILYKEAGKDLEIREVEDSLKTWQGLVGGYIEVIPFMDCLMVVNEEGKINDLPPNFHYRNDLIVGNVFFVGTKEEDFASLSESQIQSIYEAFNR